MKDRLTQLLFTRFKIHRNIKKLEEKILKENYDNIVVTTDNKNILNILSFKRANR